MQDSVLTGKRGLSLREWAAKNRLGPDFVKSLWLSVEEPEEVTYHLAGLLKGFSGFRGAQKKEVRNALLRMQIHCSVHGNSDPIKLSKQLYISQVLERLFFGSNRLHTEEAEESEKGSD